MNGKNRVKGHNRVSKSKNGFKVIRVDDFFRKKDENRGKKLAIGAGLLVGAGIGSALLLKGKGAKSLLTKKNEGSRLLTPSKKPQERSLLQKPQRKTKNVEDRVIQVSNAQKDYKSLPVEMQTILQVEKALRAPTQVSRLGRPPERTSIVQLVDNSSGKLDKAVRKAKTRLVREKTISDEAVKKN